MNLTSLPTILARIEAGTTTIHDADALRTWLRRYPPLARDLQAARAGSVALGADHSPYPSWTQRTDAAATVTLTYVQDRYARGEVVIQPTYRLTDGSKDADPSRRVHLAREAGAFVRELWDLLFETVCAVCYSEVATVAIRLDLPEMPDGAHYHVRTVAEIVAVELHVVVTGTAPVPGSVWAREEA